MTALTNNPAVQLPDKAKSTVFWSINLQDLLDAVAQDKELKQDAVDAKYLVNTSERDPEAMARLLMPIDGRGEGYDESIHEITADAAEEAVKTLSGILLEPAKLPDLPAEKHPWLNRKRLHEDRFTVSLNSLILSALPAEEASRVIEKLGEITATDPVAIDRLLEDLLEKHHPAIEEAVQPMAAEIAHAIRERL